MMMVGLRREEGNQAGDVFCRRVQDIRVLGAKGLRVQRCRVQELR
jgi:hypothetical protein